MNKVCNRSYFSPFIIYLLSAQGCNPISDIWSGYALRQCAKYLLRAVSDGSDIEARENMCLASTAAGVGFGNAGVHLCHGMSYPIASKVRSFRPTSGYRSAAIAKPAIVPHGTQQMFMHCILQI
jgi:hydroxyacid-oxoacid transhydrogenase